jgi:hypothetical protein
MTNSNSGEEAELILKCGVEGNSVSVVITKGDNVEYSVSQQLNAMFPNANSVQQQLMARARLWLTMNYPEHLMVLEPCGRRWKLTHGRR